MEAAGNLREGPKLGRQRAPPGPRYFFSSLLDARGSGNVLQIVGETTVLGFGSPTTMCPQADRVRHGRAEQEQYGSRDRPTAESFGRHSRQRKNRQPYRSGHL